MEGGQSSFYKTMQGTGRYSNYILSVMGSHWQFEAGESYDLIYIFKDRCSSCQSIKNIMQSLQISKKGYGLCKEEKK